VFELREQQQKYTERNTDDLESRNRRAMIEKVRAIWLTGVLNESLYKETLITLGLAKRPDAVERPMDLLVQRPDKADQHLPPGARIIDVYDELDSALLILGAPGSGKTTLLLELARELLNRAEQGKGHSYLMWSQ
jgi:predicted NACHT family NTPase